MDRFFASKCFTGKFQFFVVAGLVTAFFLFVFHGFQFDEDNALSFVTVNGNQVRVVSTERAQYGVV